MTLPIELKCQIVAMPGGKCSGQAVAEYLYENGASILMCWLHDKQKIKTWYPNGCMRKLIPCR